MLKKLNLLSLLTVFLCFLAQPTFAAEAAAPVGQIVSKSARIDGIQVPSGSTLLARSVLQTGLTPAVVHLADGQIVELSGNSSAYFETASAQEVKVTVRAGTLVFRERNGQIARAAAGDTVVFAASQGRAVTDMVRGVVAVLVEEAVKGVHTLKVNDTSRINPKEKVLLTTRSQKVKELHCIEKLDKSTVKVSDSLKNSFASQALLVQGPEVEKAIAAGAVIVGTCTKFGAAPLLAAGAGAGTSIVAATAGSEEKPASSSSPGSSDQ